MNKNCLLIFTRNPELGKVKTRLAKTIGDEKALEIYYFLLEKTKQVTQQIQAEKRVYYDFFIDENDLWNSQTFQKFIQKGTDLGSRMQHAFSEAFQSGFEKVIIIGSDLYDLTPEIISTAFQQLDKNDVVIGPAIDGGYYLLGMKKLHQTIFQNKNWGTESVRKDTLTDLKDKEVFLLEELNDVDVFEDIEHHPAFQHFLKDI
ncbi:TIGR04282 family arsenosugar biosynthesis glycosyltransferase [Polaribacter gangjinensis]|uniref:Glycosyltransferase n=1 Tax=Polaribacter gangjinensis TaxID=574710 RepID=A0A2S7WDY3_9FLAO|nr:TIGR04282 family arsenosugar biosynthesis glycosyltransferase [Polaribacter gangjinensis]PQJ75838.1 glycosyltransferase [Polaribacter gangjinensis]